MDVSDTVPAGHWPKRGHSTSTTKRYRLGFGGSLSAGRQGSLDGGASRVTQFQSPYFRLRQADTYRRSGPRDRLTTQLEKPARKRLRDLPLHRPQVLQALPNRFPSHRTLEASFRQNLRFNNTDIDALTQNSTPLSDANPSFKKLVNEI